MLSQAPANANGLSMTVTTTATPLFDLINTSQGTSVKYAGYDSSVNGIDITVEGDDIRVGYGVDPTTTLGRPMYKGVTYFIRGTTINNLRFISTTGNTSKVSIELGESEEGETSSSSDSGTTDNADIIATTATYSTGVSMSLADTEYTYILPSAAKSLEMRMIDDSTGQATEDFKLNIGGSVGESATDFIQIEDGELYWRQNMNIASGTVLRFQSPTASQTMRIVTYS